MFPWFWWWAPQVHWPFSGDVVQDIAPDTRWFFGAIPPQAGVGEVERKVFETASYGRQLGLITEVLLALAEDAQWKTAEAADKHRRLKALAARIEAVKRVHKADLAEATEAALRKLREEQPAAYKALMARLPAR
jgi:hypothetical protein